MEPAAEEITRTAWHGIAPEIVTHYDTLWSEPELPMMEVHAAAALCDWLERHGFQVERNNCGLPTAFRAEYGGSGTGPAIGLLAEYDALPGQGNAAVPQRAPNGKAAGHACGHNLIGPTDVGAAIAARYALERIGLDGRIVVLGTPAEEIVWGKIAQLDRGGFDGLDALLTSHADYRNGAASQPCQSGFGGEFRFLGQASHGGAPRGGNALEAAELAVQSFERLRAHHFADTSVEHVLRVGGLMPNITPDEARLWVFTRQPDYDRAGEVYDYLVEICRQIAEMTGTGFEEQFISATRGYLPNDRLAEVLYRNMERIGPPAWDHDQIDWMSQLAEACRPGEEMALDRGLGLYRDKVDSYGQDDGDASWRIPLARANWAIPRQLPFHSWAVTALMGHPASHPGGLAASEALALTAVELLARPEVIEEAKAELSERVAGREIAPPRYGAVEVLTGSPERFWDASWTTATASDGRSDGQG